MMLIEIYVEGVFEATWKEMAEAIRAGVLAKYPDAKVTALLR